MDAPITAPSRPLENMFASGVEVHTVPSIVPRRRRGTKAARTKTRVARARKAEAARAKARPARTRTGRLAVTTTPAAGTTCSFHTTHLGGIGGSGWSGRGW